MRHAQCGCWHCAAHVAVQILPLVRVPDRARASRLLALHPNIRRLLWRGSAGANRPKSSTVQLLSRPLRMLALDDLAAAVLDVHVLAPALVELRVGRRCAARAADADDDADRLTVNVCGGREFPDPDEWDVEHYRRCCGEQRPPLLYWSPPRWERLRVISLDADSYVAPSLVASHLYDSAALEYVVAHLTVERPPVSAAAASASVVIIDAPRLRKLHLALSCCQYGTSAAVASVGVGMELHLSAATCSTLEDVRIGGSRLPGSRSPRRDPEVLRRFRLDPFAAPIALALGTSAARPPPASPVVEVARAIRAGAAVIMRLGAPLARARAVALFGIVDVLPSGDDVVNLRADATMVFPVPLELSLSAPTPPVLARVLAVAAVTRVRRLGVHVSGAPSCSLIESDATRAIIESDDYRTWHDQAMARLAAAALGGADGIARLTAPLSACARWRSFLNVTLVPSALSHEELHPTDPSGIAELVRLCTRPFGPRDLVECPLCKSRFDSASHFLAHISGSSVAYYRGELVRRRGEYEGHVCRRDEFERLLGTSVREVAQTLHSILFLAPHFDSSSRPLLLPIQFRRSAHEWLEGARALGVSRVTAVIASDWGVIGDERLCSCLARIGFTPLCVESGADGSDNGSDDDSDYNEMQDADCCDDDDSDDSDSNDDDDGNDYGDGNGLAEGNGTAAAAPHDWIINRLPNSVKIRIMNYHAPARRSWDDDSPRLAFLAAELRGVYGITPAARRVTLLWAHPPGASVSDVLRYEGPLALDQTLTRLGLGRSKRAAVLRAHGHVHPPLFQRRWRTPQALTL